ncbi:MAG: type I 3-dehydroquinate dehydratase, partial [Terriglobia bacterium]
MPRRPFSDPVALVIAERDPAAFWRALSRAERTARLAELRLDYLDSVAAIVRVLERLARLHSAKVPGRKRGQARRRPRLTLIATCRRRPDGGEFSGSPSAQLALLALAARAGCQWVDVDAATLEAFPARLRRALLPPARRLVSLHDFRRCPPRLEALVGRLRGLGADKVKLAVTPRSYRELVSLLALTRRHRERLIAVPMGAVGLPGRVLALRAGSPLVYAAPEGGAAVAPGQLGWSELHDLYRAPRLNHRTRVYGLVGQPVGHSLSPPMHNAALEQARVNGVYLPFEVRDLRDFLAAVEPLGLAGFSVTHPHKQAILRHLDGVDPLAERMGAVNTVVVRGRGRLYGYNTDYVGVLRTLQRSLRLEGAQALLVGAGGAARAVAFALAA